MQTSRAPGAIHLNNVESTAQILRPLRKKDVHNISSSVASMFLFAKKYMICTVDI